MKFSDEILMAYADGELDLVARAEIEAAMARDPGVARAIERHRALGERVRTAYDGVLEEPVPERLALLAAAPDTATVVASGERRGAHGKARTALAAWRLPEWAALAASLALGLFLGMLLARGPDEPYAEADGRLVARGELDYALTNRLATATRESNVRIGISFRDRGGGYCRTFHMQREAPVAGLACRSGDDWQLRVLAAARPHQGELRPAAAMPIVVLHAVDAAIDGEPLDPAAERAARNAGWREAANVAE
jgi:hypothetical protein